MCCGKLIKLSFSRTPWQGDDETIKKIKEKGKINDEGYVNVASELGLSGMRGISPTVNRFVANVLIMFA